MERDLIDAGARHLSPDWQLAIAYNAALQVATLALAAEGYRPSRDRAHERAILSLRFTLGADTDIVEMIDRVRRKRNVINYERVGTTSESEVREMRAIAAQLHDRLITWMKQRHPELFKG
ncbi:MAG TPA: hypothetical protein VN677_03380 [Gemmatimonadaceae bacterium]|nr:hypothetical protein [Gemmatimonadaceae bacterium]